MTKMSILQEARREGYRDGWAQSSQLSWDEAYEDGRVLGWIEAEKSHKWARWVWFLAGATVSALAYWVLL